MIDNYIHDVDILDVISVPEDWQECIGIITNSFYWEEEFPKEQSHLENDLTFMAFAFDQIDGVLFEYGPPLDKTFILKMLKSFPDITQYRQFRAIPLIWWQEDQDFVSELIRNNYDSYRSAPKKERQDKSYALRAAAINGAILEFSPRKIRNDLDIAAAALQSNPFSIHFLTKKTQSKLDPDLVDHCMKIAKGDKSEIYKIDDKEVIRNIFVSLMNAGSSVHASKLTDEYMDRSNHYYPYNRRTHPLSIDDDILLYALSINPELISYFRLSQLDFLGIQLIELASKNPFLNREQIQNAQNLLFSAYIDQTKELPFVQPFKIIGHAKRMCDLDS